MRVGTTRRDIRPGKKPPKAQVPHDIGVPVLSESGRSNQRLQSHKSVQTAPCQLPAVQNGETRTRQHKRRRVARQLGRRNIQTRRNIQLGGPAAHTNWGDEQHIAHTSYSLMAELDCQRVRCHGRDEHGGRNTARLRGGEGGNNRQTVAMARSQHADLTQPCTPMRTRGCMCCCRAFPWGQCGRFSALSTTQV